MSQADGNLPGPAAIRQQMRILRPLLEALEAALTACARVPSNSSISEQYEALAALSEAHAALSEGIGEMEWTLGLPYERVINAAYTIYFDPEPD